MTKRTFIIHQYQGRGSYEARPCGISWLRVWDTVVIKPVWGHPLPDESLHRFPHVIGICSEQAEGSPMGVKRN